MRLEGCPVSQAEQQDYLAFLGEVDNPAASPELVAGKTFNIYLDYLKMSRPYFIARNWSTSGHRSQSSSTPMWSKSSMHAF